MGSAAADVLAEARGDASRRGARPRRARTREGESRVVRGVTARAQDGVRAGTVSSLLARPGRERRRTRIQGKRQTSERPRGWSWPWRRRRRRRRRKRRRRRRRRKEAKEEEEEEAKEEEEEEAKKEATASASATTATATTTSSRRRLVEGTGPGTAPRPRSNPDPTTTTTTVSVDVDATWTRAWANFGALASFAPGYLEGALAWSMPGAIYATFAAVAVASANVVSLVYLGLAALLMESKLSDSPRRRALSSGRWWRGSAPPWFCFSTWRRWVDPRRRRTRVRPRRRRVRPHRRRVRPRRRPRRDRRRRSARPPRRRRPRRDRRDPRDRRGRRTRRPRRRRRRRRTSNVRTRSTSDRPSNRTSRRGVFSGRTNPFRRRRRRTAIARRDGWRWRRGRARSSSGIFSRFSSPRRNFAWMPRSPTPRRRSIEPPRSTTTTNDRGSAQARVLRSNPGRAWTRRFSARFRLAEARFRASPRRKKRSSRRLRQTSIATRASSRRSIGARARRTRSSSGRDTARFDTVSKPVSSPCSPRARVHPRRASRRLPRARALSPATARRRPRPPRRTLQVPQILQHIRHRRRVGEPGARRRRVGRRVRADLARVRRVAHPRRRGMDVGDENRARVRRGSTRRRSDHLRGVLRGSRAVGIARTRGRGGDGARGARGGARRRRGETREVARDATRTVSRRDAGTGGAEAPRRGGASAGGETLEGGARARKSRGTERRGIGEAIREWEAENTADEEATATATADRAAVSRASEEATATATADRAAVSRASEDATATATADRAAVSARLLRARGPENELLRGRGFRARASNHGASRDVDLRSEFDARSGVWRAASFRAVARRARVFPVLLPLLPRPSPSTFPW